MTEETGTPRIEAASIGRRARCASRWGAIAVGSEFDTLDAMDMLHGYMLMRSAKSFHGVSERFSNALAHKVNRAKLKATKADELAYSTQTGFGDEWVPDLWSQQIWHKARQDNTILTACSRASRCRAIPLSCRSKGRIQPCILCRRSQDESHLVLGSRQSDSGQQSGLGQGDAECQETGAAGRIQQRTGGRRGDPGAEYLSGAGGTGDY